MLSLLVLNISNKMIVNYDTQSNFIPRHFSKSLEEQLDNVFFKNGVFSGILIFSKP